MYTRAFGEISRDDVAAAGGKGAFLGELTRQGVSVPPGFVVLTDAFRRFLDVEGLDGPIRETLDAARRGAVSEEVAAEELSRRILNASIPAEMAEEISLHHARLGADLVAVRSSATAEDNADRSWAGQLESYLNVTAETLLLAVKRCWASLFSRRAIAYRLSDAAEAGPIDVAVVVQAMVNPEVAGVAFSVDPVTENLDEIVIEAAFGLGESIVQGTVTPDHYQVSKSTFAVLDAFLSPQERGIYRLEDGSTGWRSLDAAMVDRRKLDDAELARLAREVVAIEKVAGFPCDLEWVWERGRFSIVQCRPITTLG